MSVCGSTAVPASCCFPTLGSGGGKWRNTVVRKSSSCLRVNGMASLRRHIHHALSASNQCCLTRRSTGPATAGGVSLARSGFATVARQAYTACLRGPVSSNVRQHNSAMLYLRLRRISNTNPNASVRCPQTSQDATEQWKFCTVGASIHDPPLRFAAGNCYALLQALECQFVDPPPYQHRAASLPWAAAVGNGAVPPYAYVLLVSGQ